jgi:hypothetical protein
MMAEPELELEPEPVPVPGPELKLVAVEDGLEEDKVPDGNDDTKGLTLFPPIACVRSKMKGPLLSCCTRFTLWLLDLMAWPCL